MQEGADVEVSASSAVVQSVDDDGGSAPGGARLANQIVGADRLPTGVDSVVDEQNAAFSSSRNRA